MSSLSTYLVQTSLSLLALGGIAWLLMRFKRDRAVTSKDSLELVSRLSLDPRRAIYLVRAKDQLLVIGASEGGLRLLQNLTPTQAASPIARTLPYAIANAAGTLASADPASRGPAPSSGTPGHVSEVSPDGEAEPSLRSYIGQSNVGLTSEPFSDPSPSVARPDLALTSEPFSEAQPSFARASAARPDVALTSEPFSEAEPDLPRTSVAQPSIDSIGRRCATYPVPAQLRGSDLAASPAVGRTLASVTPAVASPFEDPAAVPPESADRIASHDDEPDSSAPRLTMERPAAARSNSEGLLNDAVPDTVISEAGRAKTLMSKR